MNPIIQKYRLAILNLRDVFGKNFNNYQRARKDHNHVQKSFEQYIANNNERGRSSIRDVFLTMGFIFLVTMMTSVDFLMVSPLVELNIEHNVLGGFLTNLLKISFTLLLTAVQILFCHWSKKKEDLYDSNPDLPPPHLKLSRSVKFIAPILMYTCVLLYKLILLAGNGDMLAFLGGFFGYVALLIFAIFVHVIFVLSSRSMFGALARLSYNLMYKIHRTRLHRAEKRMLRCDQKTKKSFEALYEQFTNANRKFPEHRNVFTFRPSREEEAYIRLRYNMMPNAHHDPSASASYHYSYSGTQ